MIAIQARHLVAAFDGTRVFDDLSLDIAVGELFCIMGPNGTGKTTLLRVLAGLQPAAAGELTTASPPRLMFQETDFFPWLTLGQNLALGLTSSSHTPATYRRLCTHFLTEVGLEGREGAYPHELSGGERQRAALARCFASGADIVLMDEPFSHLDPTSRLRLQRLLIDLWRETGATIVLVTHDPQEAALLGRRVMVMQSPHARVVLDTQVAEAGEGPQTLEKAARGPAQAVIEALRATPEPKEAAVRRLPRRDRVSALLFVLSPLLAISLWEVAARQGFIDPRFFPAPTDVMVTLEGLARSGDLWKHVRVSSLRLALGLLAGGGLGIAVGGMMGAWPRFKAVAEPLVALTYPLPKIAILPLLLVIFHIGETSKVVTLAIGAFFLLLLATLQGVEDVRRRYDDTIRSLRLRRWNLYARTYFLGALSPILTGVRAAAGYCLVLMVAVEFTGTNDGVGYLVWRSWELFDIETMYAGLVILALAGFVLFSLVSEISRRIPWTRETTPL